MEPTDLQPLELPSREEGWLDWVNERAGGGLSLAGAEVAALKDATPGDEAILQVWNDIGIALGNVFAISSLISVVHPDAAVMEAAEAFQIEARRFATDLHLDSGVCSQLSSLDAGALEPGARRVLEHALRDFRRAGVDRDEATRERLRELNGRESELSQAFSRVIRDGRLTTLVPAEALAGLPVDYLADHPADEHGQVEIGTDYPDTLPFLTTPATPSSGAASRTPSSTSAGRRTRRLSPSCSRCASRRPPCWGTTTGRATTPRSR